MTARARADAYPEMVLYRDTGCSVSPSCLACPLAVCRYDVPLVPLATAVSRERRVRVVALWDGGMAVGAIASAVGLTERSVYRVLRAGAGKGETTIGGGGT